MEFFHGTNIDFIGKRKYFFGFTLILTLFFVFAFVRQRGPIMGLEFTGGTLVQIGFKQLPPIDHVREKLSKEGWTNVSLQTEPANQTLIIKVKGEAKSKDTVASDILKILKQSYPDNVKTLPDRVEYIGPVVGRSLILNTYMAIFGSLAVICIYVAFRFRNWIWGVSGVLALAHDVFMTWGLLTFLNRETTLVVIAALLTLAGYSINDTIVIFDRVRENLRTSRKESNHDLYNRSLNETMGRTINTSLTAFIASLTLFFLGGEVLHDFALAMSFGVFIGTYSSVGVALSLVYEIEERRRTRKS
jgi:preprotein translocase subunit SecF